MSSEKVPIFGELLREDVTTSHVKRNDLTMRMHMGRFTRLTNAFSKKLANHHYAVTLHFAYYNFCRPHTTLTKARGVRRGEDNSRHGGGTDEPGVGD